jgi:hypothetical protein
VAGHSVHHPEAGRLLRQVLGAVCEQVPPANSVVLLSAGELSQGAAVQAQRGEFLLRLHLCAFHLCWCDHSLLSDAHLGNQRLVTRELGGVPGQHHLDRGPSTGPACSAARTSRPATTIRAVDAIRATQINFPGDSQTSTH